VYRTGKIATVNDFDRGHLAQTADQW